MRRSPAPGSHGEPDPGSPAGAPSARDRRKPVPRRLVRLGGVVLLCGGLAGSLLLARYVRDDLQDTARHRIDVTTSAVIGHLTATLKRYGDLVTSTGAFVSSVSPRADYATSRQAFLDYLASLQLHQQYPGVYGVGFISRVPASQAPAVDAQMKAAGQPGFNLPQPGAAYACPVTYFDWTGAGSSPGAYLTADICGIGQVQDLLMQAQSTGEPVVAAQVSFAGGPNHKYDFAVIDPVFPAGAAVTTPAERSAALQGWSIGLFQGSTLAAGLIPSGSPELAVRVFTGPSTNANDLVFASSNHLPGGLVQGTRRTVEEDGPWTLQIFRGPVGGPSTDLVPLAILAAGLLVTGAIFLVMGVLSRSEAVSRREVERATASLQQREALFRSIATFLPTGIMQIDRNGSCVYANPMMSHITGRREEALLDFAWFDAIHPDDRKDLRDTLGPQVGNRRELSHHARLITPRGRVLDASIRASALMRTDGDIEGYVVWVEDVTQQVRTRDHLQHLALHDPLTGLPNRALFVDRLHHALGRAHRGDAALALLFLDLDRFKLVNDNLGHQAGDELLVLTAERIGGLLRADETLARMGGDEFAILLEDVSAAADATSVAARIISTLEDPFVLHGSEAFVSASIGVVISTDADLKPDTLLRDADTAMYQAKNRGGGSFEVFDAELHDTVVNRLETESSLRRALDNGELTVHYQPQLDTVTNEIVGVEALVRWNHPRRGLIDPSEFVPLAEETGLIVPIGSWVLRRAIRDLARWHKRLPWLTPRLAVNLSARQLAETDVASNVLEALYDAGFDPSSLCLEVTESILMAETTPGFDTLGALKALGVHIAIDDFGTGFSSLAALKRLPVDVLKIDRSFVVDLESGERDRALLAGVVAIGHSLGLEIVAEGVEDLRQVEILREIGAEVGQGFFWCTPVPGAELIAWAEAHDRAIGHPRPPWSGAGVSTERQG